MSFPRTRNSREPRRQHGFSLLELLVAFAIMAMSLGMLYRTAGGSARGVGDAEQYQRAAILAESILSLRDAVPEGGWNQKGESGGFRWRVRSVEPPLRSANPSAPALYEVVISISWGEGSSRQIELETLRPVRKTLVPGGAR